MKRECLSCYQAKTAEDVGETLNPSIVPRYVAAAIASTLTTLALVELLGLEEVMGNLCAGCKEAFAVIRLTLPARKAEG